MVARWLQIKGLARYPLVLGLSGDTVMFQTVPLDNEDPRTLEQAAALEATRFQEIADEQTTHTALNIRAGDGKRRMLLFISRSAALDPLFKTYTDQALNVVGLAPKTTAVFNFMAPLLRKRRRPYILANAGHTRTEMGVGLGGALFFARSLAGFSLVPPAGVSSAALDSAAEKWVKDLQTGLKTYRSLYPQKEQTPQAIVLSGDACRIPGFKAAVRKHMSLEVIDIEKLLIPSYPRDGECFAAATGAAVSLLTGAPAPVTLLPAAARENLLLKTQKRYWAAAGATAVLMLVVLLAGGYRNTRRASRQLEREKQAIMRCENLVSAIELQQKRNFSLSTAFHPVRDLVFNGILFQDLLTAVAVNSAPEDAITTISDSTSYFHRRESMENPPSLDRVIIEGFTPHRDLSTVSALIDRLRKLPFIDQRTDMLADDKLLEEDNPWKSLPATKDLRLFVIDVYLKAPEENN